jgi:glycosyltransferase involved in cell wall biosynthesis
MITNKVTATLSTKGRHHNTLPLVITSIVNQTVKPARLIIYDDNDTLEDLRENPIYKNLFPLMNRVGIAWEVTVGNRKGQVQNHQRALTDVKTEWIWRLDDDNIMENNTLEKLLECGEKDDKIGAVGPLILDPKREINHSMASNNIKDMPLGMNIQWCDPKKETAVEVDHLQGSTFLFRKEAAKHGYELKLSKVGHREETIFTYEMRRAGWKLIVLTGVKTWHLRYGAGGIRSDHQVKLFEQDDKIFDEYVKKWGIKFNEYKICPLNSGVGDHYAFKMALPAIKEKFKKHTIVIGACYPEIFQDDTDVKVVSLSEACSFVKEEDYNIYRWMDHRNWKKSLTEAYKELYTT